MKKIIIILFTTVLAVCTCGCGSLLKEVIVSSLESTEEEHVDEEYQEEEVLVLPKESETPDALGGSDDQSVAVKDSETLLMPEGFFDPTIDRIEVSSQWDNAHEGHCAVDGNDETDWITEEGETEDAWIKIYFTEKFMVTDILLTNKLFEYAHIQAFELEFDDGTTEICDVRVPDAYDWSISIAPHPTSWIKLKVLSAYEGIWFDQLALSEIRYFYNSDSMFIGQSGDNGTAAGDLWESIGPGEDTSGYIPEWWTWTPTGYDAQDYDDPKYRAGKWVSADGQVVLYLDWSDSMDYFSYGLYDRGVGGAEGTAEVFYTYDNGFPEVLYAQDLEMEVGKLFEIIDDKVMKLTQDDMGIYVDTLYLKKGKYSFYE